MRRWLEGGGGEGGSRGRVRGRRGRAWRLRAPMRCGAAFPFHGVRPDSLARKSEEERGTRAGVVRVTVETLATTAAPSQSRRVFTRWRRAIHSRHSGPTSLPTLTTTLIETKLERGAFVSTDFFLCFSPSTAATRRTHEPTRTPGRAVDNCGKPGDRIFFFASRTLWKRGQDPRLDQEVTRCRAKEPRHEGAEAGQESRRAESGSVVKGRRKLAGHKRETNQKGRGEKEKQGGAGFLWVGGQTAERTAGWRLLFLREG